MDELKAYVHEAHEDARRKLRTALAQDLSPFKKPTNDPTYGYPHDLHISTLMGYFGEILAGVAAEHTIVHGEGSWVVPAFHFRFHQVAFQKLEDRRTLLLEGSAVVNVDDASAVVPGRTGSDTLAFLRSHDGEIRRVMACEAKCLANHDVTKLSKAHSQLSVPQGCPSGVRELIHILADYDDKPAQEWQEALRRFRFNPPAQSIRVDVLLYATGDSPSGKKGRFSWTSTRSPAPEYKCGRRLEVIEVHLPDIQALVRDLYRA